MRSLQLHAALSEFVEEAGACLQEDVRAGEEVPFELESRTGRRGADASLYCYRALTGQYIAERQPELERLPSHAQARSLLIGFEGLERYLAAAGVECPARAGHARARAALILLLQEVFAEQSDFRAQPERVRAALERLHSAAGEEGQEVTLVATLHGLMIGSPELALTKGLKLAQPGALEGLPDGALGPAAGRAGADGAADRLVVVLSAGEADAREALATGRAVLAELLRALRLFGDGRIALGPLAWASLGGGAWRPVALGAGGRPHGMLLVTPEQEDELRAFCNLVSRRAPQASELAWALRRYELGCERESPYEALSDHLLALRALLEPEGPHSGMLVPRLSALCATEPEREQMRERAARALALEREVVTGAAVAHAGGVALAEEIADHLRALLRDVICGHLPDDLISLADELLARESAPATPAPARPRDQGSAQPQGSAQQVLGYAGEPEEVLDLFV